MRSLLSILAFLFVVATVSAQDSTSFKTVTHSFGKVPQGKPVSTVFAFTNNSPRPLIIETATAECGCTTPEYPKTPIMKGKDGEIKVTYNAEAPGKFTKRVTVKFANIQQPVVLTIDGEVETKGTK